MRKKAIDRAIILFLVVMIATVVYNVYDNHRFEIVEQRVAVERLPAAFDGFRILQISDLHGRSFGPNQRRLVEAINDLEYDMIAFTGDMNRSSTLQGDVTESTAVLQLLDGIENKEDVFWIDGNTGPHAIEDISGAYTGALTPIGAVLQEKGCKMLMLPYAIQRGEDRIWITLPLSEIDFLFYEQIGEERFGDKEAYTSFQRHYRALYEAFQTLHGNSDVKILLDHYPRQMNMSAEALEETGGLDYDLILAGHYHGGQWRLPFWGALYIPSPTAGINGSGFLPKQDKVKGLTYSGDVPQYVSAGLGASGHWWWTNFRLFNTPEINVITLTAVAPSPQS